MVFEVRDLWPEVAIAMGALKSPVARHAARRLERYAYFNAAHVVALSPDMKDGVMATGYPGEQVSVIANSCDFDLFDVGEEAGDCVRRDHDWLGTRPLALFVGTFGAANDVGWLIDLAAAVHHHNTEVRFWLAGSGNEHGLVRARAAKHGLLNRSVFIGESVAKREVPAMLSAANLSLRRVCRPSVAVDGLAEQGFRQLGGGDSCRHQLWRLAGGCSRGVWCWAGATAGRHRCRGRDGDDVSGQRRSSGRRQRGGGEARHGLLLA